MAHIDLPVLPERCPSCQSLGPLRADPSTRIWGKKMRGKIQCESCQAEFCPDCWGKCEGCSRVDSTISVRAFIHGTHGKEGCGYRCCEFCSVVRKQVEAHGVRPIGDFTLRELQTKLPWTIHYHRDFRASPMAHKDFAHALLHVQKACGKLAAVVNDAEHGGSEFTQDEVDRYVADLVVCALRMANTCPGRMIDLQKAVVDRIESKNGVTL